jgi:hypothetical protein
LLMGRNSYRSADDGKSWTFIKSVNWDGQFSFSDPQYGWAIARSNTEIALVKTVNGGGYMEDHRAGDLAAIVRMVGLLLIPPQRD